MPINNYLHKQYLILNIINHLGPISRTELSLLTDYRPASVSAIVKDLLDQKLILETGQFSTGQGRKRTLLEVNNEHLCAIGISFSSKHVTYIVSQVNGVILYQTMSPLLPGSPKEELIQKILAKVSGLLDMFGNKKLVGIGISDPPYDPAVYQQTDSLIANYTHFNSWVHKQLKSQLEALSGLPVQTYSGVTMPAMAEQRFGVAKGVRNFICIELSNGIGASICCNGMPVGGEHGKAAELGHTVIDYSATNQKLCYCGKPGCVETSTAFPALAAKISGALNQGVLSVLKSYQDLSDGITIQAIRWALDNEDQMCMYYVKDIAIRLGVAIANAVNLLNPKLVVLYGFMLELGDFFLRHLESSIRENVFAPLKDFEIRTSNSTETLFSLGAVAEIFSFYFKQENYRWVYQLQPESPDEKVIVQDNP